MTDNLPPLTVRDQELRLYLEALARRLQALEHGCCGCACGSSSGQVLQTGTSGTGAVGTGASGASVNGGYFANQMSGSGQWQQPTSVYDLGSSTTLATAELNRTHYINATAAVDVNLPELQTGLSVVIVNTGTNTITVKDSTGTTVTTVAAGDSTSARAVATGAVMAS